MLNSLLRSSIKLMVGRKSFVPWVYMQMYIPICIYVRIFCFIFRHRLNFGRTSVALIVYENFSNRISTISHKVGHLVVRASIWLSPKRNPVELLFMASSEGWGSRLECYWPCSQVHSAANVAKHMVTRNELLHHADSFATYLYAK